MPHNHLLKSRTSNGVESVTGSPLLDTLQDAAVSLNPDGTIVYWNKAASEMFGYESSEVYGQPFTILLPRERRTEWRFLFEGMIEGHSIERYEIVQTTKTGELLDISLSGSEMCTDEGEQLGVLLFLRNMTEVHRSERAMEQLQQNSNKRLVLLETASRVALDILSSRTGVEALRHIADAARTLAGARYAALGVAAPDGGLLEFVTVGLTPEEEAKIGSRPRGAGILGLLLQRAEPLRIGVLNSHSSSVGFPPNHPPMDSFLGVPIRRGETNLGSLYLTNKIDGSDFTEADEVAVSALGSHAAVAIHNLQMLSRQRALLSGLINAQEEERRAVAYDLHDGLTQYVMASHMHMEAFRKARDSGNQAKADRDLQNGLDYLKEAVVESRRLVNGLRSLALDDLGLAGAVEVLFAEEKTRAGWTDAELTHNIAERRLEKSLETAVYRVIQEALTNVRKHAQTKKVRVSLYLSADESDAPRLLTIEVRDWGHGFVPEEKTNDASRVGLQGMAERVSLTGGTYSLHATPSEGVTVRATFPVLELQNS